jgi:hypothetical protein
LLGWDREVVGGAPPDGLHQLSSGEIELVWGNHRNRGRREGGLLELLVKVVPAYLPLSKSSFEMHRALPDLRGLGKFA